MLYFTYFLFLPWLSCSFVFPAVYNCLSNFSGTVYLYHSLNFFRPPKRFLVPSIFIELSHFLKFLWSLVYSELFIYWACWSIVFLGLFWLLHSFLHPGSSSLVVRTLFCSRTYMSNFLRNCVWEINFLNPHLETSFSSFTFHNGLTVFRSPGWKIYHRTWKPLFSLYWVCQWEVIC